MQVRVVCRKEVREYRRTTSVVPALVGERLWVADYISDAMICKEAPTNSLRIAPVTAFEKGAEEVVELILIARRRVAENIQSVRQERTIVQRLKDFELLVEKVKVQAKAPTVAASFFDVSRGSSTFCDNPPQQSITHPITKS